MSINKELNYREFMQRENGLLHSPYQNELGFYSAVSAGDLDRVMELYTPLAVEGYGKLSADPIRNIKYHLVITIALIARFCIEAGMPMETAYTISDIFINRLDVSTTEQPGRPLWSTPSACALSTPGRLTPSMSSPAWTLYTIIYITASGCRSLPTSWG